MTVLAAADNGDKQLASGNSAAVNGDSAVLSSRRAGQAVAAPQRATKTLGDIY
jgi:hypothetical protein